MSIITKVLRQRVVYWAPLAADDYGRPTYAAPVELGCRWEDTSQEIIRSDLTRVLSRAKVMVSEDVVVGGMLLFGELPDESGASGLESGDSGFVDYTDPRSLGGACEIIAFQKTPNIRCTESLREAFL